MRYNRSIKSLVTLSLVGFATPELEQSHKQCGKKTEAGILEPVQIFCKADFDQEKFETVIRGYAERSKQRLKIAQMILISHINSMNITEQSAYADHIELVLTRDS